MSLTREQQQRLLDLATNLTEAGRLNALPAKDHAELALLVGERDGPGLFHGQVFCQIKRPGCFSWIAPEDAVFHLAHLPDGIVPGNLRLGCKSCSVPVEAKDAGRPFRLGTDPDFNRQLG